MNGSAPPETVDRFLDHVEHGEPHLAIELSVDLLEREGVASTVTGFLAPAQREVGSRWHVGRYTVAQEHLFSAVVEDVLGISARYTPPSQEGEHAVALVCAEGEWHSTPARMASLLLRQAGWRVHFFGASTPPDHLRATLAELGPQAVAVSCTLPLALPGAARIIEVAHSLGLPAVVGGGAFDPGGHRAAQLGADGCFADVEMAAQQLRAWLDRPPVLAASAAPGEGTFQRGVLSVQRDGIVDDAYVELEGRLPIMTRFDDRQRHHTREDLGYLLSFADVALLVDDPNVLTDVVTWLADLLAARGLPPHVMDETLQALRSVLGTDLPVVEAWLELAGLTLADRPSEGRRSS
jgi:methanogenic corrinoid protein MtbC1